jgi:UDP-3-O-[3-hydroxymyristoyl] glucosamine N-acyltransferase
MSEVRSELGRRTVLDDYVALGDEVTVYAGVRLEGHVAIFPRLKVPGGIQVPRDTDVTGPADILRHL